MSATRTFEVQVKRDNRWDPYPSQEPVETIIVRVTRAQQVSTERQDAIWCQLLADRSRLASAIADSIPQQHPKWRIVSPLLVDFKEVAE